MLGYSFMGKAHSNAYRQMPHFFYPPPAIPVMKMICGIGAAEVQKAQDQLGWEEGTESWEEARRSGRHPGVRQLRSQQHPQGTLYRRGRVGKHIICEKPLALNAKDAAEMAHAVNQAGVKAMVAFNYRRVPAIVLAKKLIDEGMIGKIYHYRAVYLQDWIMDPNFPLVWRLQKELAGSGPDGDLNAHILDLSNYLVGKIGRVCGMTETFIKERPLEGQGGGSLGAAKSAGKKMGKVTVRGRGHLHGQVPERRARHVRGHPLRQGPPQLQPDRDQREQGLPRLQPGTVQRARVFLRGRPEVRPRIQDDQRDRGSSSLHCELVAGRAHHRLGTHLHARIFEFFKAIAEDSEISPSFDDGVYNNKVLDAVLDSAAKGTWVNIP